MSSKQRPVAGSGREQSQPEAGRPRLGATRTIPPLRFISRELGTRPEAGAREGLHRAITHRAVARWHPSAPRQIEARPRRPVARGEKTGEQVRPTGRVVRQVGGDDRDSSRRAGAHEALVARLQRGRQAGARILLTISRRPASPRRSRLQSRTPEPPAPRRVPPHRPPARARVPAVGEHLGHDATREAMSGRPAARLSKTTRDIPSDSSGT